MDSELDRLILDFMRKTIQLTGNAQNVTVSVSLYNNRLNWNVTIQHVGEDQTGFSKNRPFNGGE